MKKLEQGPKVTQLLKCQNQDADPGHLPPKCVFLTRKFVSQKIPLDSNTLRTSESPPNNWQTGANAVAEAEDLLQGHQLWHTPSPAAGHSSEQPMHNLCGFYQELSTREARGGEDTPAKQERPATW